MSSKCHLIMQTKFSREFYGNMIGVSSATLCNEKREKYRIKATATIDILLFCPCAVGREKSEVPNMKHYKQIDVYMQV